MSYYSVYVVDRITKAEVCIGNLLTRNEASTLLRTFEKYDVDAYIVEYYYKKGKVVEI